MQSVKVGQNERSIGHFDYHLSEVKVKFNAA